MKNGALDTAIFLLLTVIVVDSMPTVTDFHVEENGAWRDIAVRRFYGPWSDVRKQNGDYADYDDYGTPPPRFQEYPMVDDPTDGYSQDFSPGRSMDLADFNAGYEFGPIGLAVFSVGIHPDSWLSKSRDHEGGFLGNSLPHQNFDKDDNPVVE